GRGQIVAVGEKVSRFQEGDQVYGLITTRNPKSGFYAEYAAVHTEHAWPLPGTLTTVQAGAMPIDAGTALRGLRDLLGLKRGASPLPMVSSPYPRRDPACRSRATTPCTTQS